MGPLTGIHVLDFSRLAPGPYCSMLLADMGAAVVRVDRAPLGSDIPPFVGDVLGRGKRSVALNLKHDEGPHAARRLATRADVVIEGFRPGVMERFGLGPVDLMADNPGLVYARITGWGQRGPLAASAGHDIDYIAIAGVLGAIGRAGGPPVPPINLLADFGGGGLMSAFGVLSALLERQRSGTGQVVDAAMIDGAISLMAVFAVAIQQGSWGPYGTNLVDTGSHFYETYETSDGGYMAVGAMEPEFYARFLEGLGLDGEDLPDQMDAASWPAMKERVGAIFRTKTRDDWTAIFGPRRRVRGAGAATDRGARAPAQRRPRGVRPRASPAWSSPRRRHACSRTPGRVAGPPPECGGDTRAVLAEIGYSAADLDGLADTGTIAWP